NLSPLQSAINKEFPKVGDRLIEKMMFFVRRRQTMLPYFLYATIHFCVRGSIEFGNKSKNGEKGIEFVAIEV
ncbi:hypothetical protein, partial [Bacteroides bouchesdurhonensis]